MCDLALVWYTMLDDDVRASRDDVRTWAEELGLPSGTLSKTSTAGAFRKANARTVVAFTPEDGIERTLTSREIGKSREVIKYEVHATVDGDADGEKVAEVKLFQQRRTSRGVVKGSQQWRATIKPALEGAEREAAEAWVDKFKGHYNDIAVDAPSGAVRRIVRLALMINGIPVLNRLGVYVFYVDQLSMVRRVEEFLARCVDNVDVAVIPILPDPKQLHRFSESADQHMVARLGELTDAVQSWGSRKLTVPLARDMIPRFLAEAEMLAERIAEHERRLDCELPHARHVLHQVEELLDGLEDNPNLLSSRSE